MTANANTLQSKRFWIFLSVCCFRKEQGEIKDVTRKDFSKMTGIQSSVAKKSVVLDPSSCSNGFFFFFAKLLPFIKQETHKAAMTQLVTASPNGTWILTGTGGSLAFRPVSMPCCSKDCLNQLPKPSLPLGPLPYYPQGHALFCCLPLAVHLCC